MFRRFSRLAVLAAVVFTAGVSSAETGSVLYWMIDDSATVSVNGGKVGLSEFFSVHELAGDGSAFAARIRVIGGDIGADDNVFLDLYIPGYGVDVDGGEYGVEFSEVGGHWGAGVPTGNQSPSADAYSAGTPEYSFMVELGNIDSSDNWTTVATSAAATYSSLANYIHQTFDMNPSSMAVWTPTTFYIPEPSSGLLAAIGLAFLALRRRKCQYRNKS